MFKSKLNALNFEFTDDFNYKDSIQFRQLIAWIEDQKIRHYKIEDRVVLRDVDNSQWQSAFLKYLSDLNCPFDGKQIELVLDWILTLAIRFQYEDNLEKYQTLKTEDMKRTEPQMVQKNPIDNLDFDSNEFKEGVKHLAQLLKVPAHPTDHLITLRAVCLLIRKHISMESKDKNQQIEQKLNKIEDNSMTLKVGNDYVLNSCAKVVRLLYVQDLRELQTTINEIIASVQSITANPKTDTNLGKVGI